MFLCSVFVSSWHIGSLMLLNSRDVFFSPSPSLLWANVHIYRLIPHLFALRVLLFISAAWPCVHLLATQQEEKEGGIDRGWRWREGGRLVLGLVFYLRVKLLPSSLLIFLLFFFVLVRVDVTPTDGWVSQTRRENLLPKTHKSPLLCWRSRFIPNKPEARAQTIPQTVLALGWKFEKKKKRGKKNRFKI